ncbi:hypothetical protein BpHYR1_039787 [Brachionus plicatilis]|uniref:Uncharacterized protein n=1 Tax=Brachionus plicatilis TaxID=10195 RepID=A0A3M7QFD6_BRAPC|nr:hypothetical protein BpHYR1_039787 [Brachionus plicatilis]
MKKKTRPIGQAKKPISK